MITYLDQSLYHIVYETKTSIMQDPDNVLYSLNHYKPLIDKAIKQTEEYVSKHKLILTGGMAIDLALREKNESIYDDDTLPDYDIISDTNLIHANALAEQLCNEGLPDINVINAVHITTVRVRIKNVVLLDATYVPPICMKQIPFLDVGHLRVVHPHYQFIDQRLSLSHLMADTGISLNIFNRLTKDMNRNALLRSLYPIESKPKEIQTRTVKIPLDIISIDDNHFNQIDQDAFVYTGSGCLSGYVGMILMIHLHENTLDKIKIKDNHLEVQVPPNVSVRILSCNIKSLKSYLKSPVMYRPLINLKPISMHTKDFEYVDTYGSRIGCNIIELTDGIKVCVASTDYLIMENLRDRIYVDKELFTHLYNQILKIVEQKRSEEDSDNIWWPSLNCYGSDNLPEYKVFMLEKIMDPNPSTLLKPQNSYPYAPKCKTRMNFAPEDSHYFRIDGIKDDTLEHSNYSYIIDQFNEFVDKKRKENTKHTN